jgi:hypothetical protein
MNAASRSSSICCASTRLIMPLTRSSSASITANSFPAMSASSKIGAGRSRTAASISASAISPSSGHRARMSVMAWSSSSMRGPLRSHLIEQRSALPFQRLDLIGWRNVGRDRLLRRPVLALAVARIGRRLGFPKRLGASDLKRHEDDLNGRANGHPRRPRS